MSDIIFIFLESILISISLSTDAFVASFAYGTNKIRISILSTIIISTVCSLMLGISLYFGFVISNIVPQYITKRFCFILLIIIGIIRLFDSYIKNYIRKDSNIHKKISFSLFHLNFILNIYADPEKADIDKSLTLSPYESAFLAFALSIDSLAVGISAAIGDINYIMVIITTFVSSVLAVHFGYIIGKKVSKDLKFDLSWLSGILLILLAFLKL